jgi:hypothetical protein
MMLSQPQGSPGLDGRVKLKTISTRPFKCGTIVSEVRSPARISGICGYTKGSLKEEIADAEHGKC